MSEADQLRGLHPAGAVCLLPGRQLQPRGVQVPGQGRHQRLRHGGGPRQHPGQGGDAQCQSGSGLDQWKLCTGACIMQTFQVRLNVLLSLYLRTIEHAMCIL